MTDNSTAPGQGSAGSTDVVTALQGVRQQIQAGNAQLALILAALQAINFPETVPAYTVATLPAAPTGGSLAYVTDGGAALAWGANISGGSTVTYLVFWNGTHWTVAGK